MIVTTAVPITTHWRSRAATWSGPKRYHISRRIPNTPVFTTATACRSPLTGVGATIALGSHPWRGTSAAFTPSPKKSRMKARRANCGPIAAMPGLPPGIKSRVFAIPIRAMIPARIATPPHWV